MDGKLTEYLDRYEKELRTRLTELCTELRFMNGQLLLTDDLDEVWTRCAPEYMADAVPNIAQYPSAALAWAAYFGMAVARLWDRRWDEVQKWPDPYAVIRDARGFDEMDEYVTEEILGYLPESNGHTPRGDRAAERDGVPCLCADSAHTVPYRRKRGAVYAWL